jgi:hypothetical protein
MKEILVTGCLVCVLSLVLVLTPATAFTQDPDPQYQYRVYLPLMAQQTVRPAPLIAPNDGVYQLIVQRGKTDATWQQMYFACDRDVDGQPDAGYKSPGELTANTPTLTTTIPISQGQRLEIRLYADTFGSVITPHPIWYGWDSAHTRVGAPGPLVVAGNSPWETYWECDGDYDHRDLRLEVTFEEQP